jgi:hypothetical protein
MVDFDTGIAHRGPFLFYGHLSEEQSSSEIHTLLKHNASRRMLPFLALDARW